MQCIDVLRELDFEHIAGSKEELKAKAIIIKHLKEAKVSYEEQTFKMIGFDNGTAKIEFEGLCINASPYGLVESQVIEGELVILNNIDILNFNKGAYKDKIIMCKGSSRNAFDVMIKQGVKAFINVGAPDKEESNLSLRQKNVETGILPSVTIKYDLAVDLLAFNGKNIKIVIDQNREERTATNIVATVGSSTIDENITYLTAHYDTVAQSHGSSDNGAGTVVILKVAKYFAENHPNRQLKIIFCSGEELGLLGSSAYVEQNLEEVKEKGSLVINVDVAGDHFGRDAMMVIGTHDLKGYMSAISKEAGFCFHDMVTIYSSDAMPFAVYEIPSVNLARFGGNASGVIHTSKDTIENISSDNLEFYYESTINILNRVLNAKIWPIKKEIDPTLRGKIESYMWGSRREAPKLEWTPKYKK